MDELRMQEAFDKVVGRAIRDALGRGVLVAIYEDRQTQADRAEVNRILRA